MQLVAKVPIRPPTHPSDVFQTIRKDANMTCEERAKEVERGKEISDQEKGEAQNHHQMVVKLDPAFDQSRLDTDTNHAT